MIFTEKGARYANHTSRQINVPPKVGKWETIDHWPSGVEEAGKHPSPLINYNSEPTTVLKVTSQYSQKRNFRSNSNKTK